MRKIIIPVILTLLFGYGVASAKDKVVKRIHVDSTNITHVKSISRGYELNVTPGDTSNPYYNFVLSSNKRDSRQGGFAASIDGLAARINDKLSGKVGKTPDSSYVLIYRQQQTNPDSLTTLEWNQLMNGLGRDSVFFFDPKARDEYLF